ncbi:MAG: polyphenol oxidase family protein [Propionibacteriaceae bacterium]|jgi:YfiH family protein|nr:polyphenol oxidase family protein [Propionibacteriaceae bacterium]
MPSGIHAELPFDVVRPDWGDLEWLDVFTTLAATGGTGHTFAGVGSNAARKLLGKALKPIELTWIYSNHGTVVERVPVPATNSEDVALCDAFIVTTPGNAAALPTGDCLPIVIADVDTRQVALAHAGWKGLAAGIIEKTATEMLGASPLRARDSLRAWIGPSINAADYEVGDEVREALLALPAASPAHFQPTRPGKCLADLKAIARAELIRNSVPAKTITSFPVSTYRAANLHSFRRDGAKSGRIATVVAILDN